MKDNGETVGNSAFHALTTIADLLKTAVENEQCFKWEVSAGTFENGTSNGSYEIYISIKQR